MLFLSHSIVLKQESILATRLEILSLSSHTFFNLSQISRLALCRYSVNYHRPATVYLNVGVVREVFSDCVCGGAVQIPLYTDTANCWTGECYQNHLPYTQLADRTDTVRATIKRSYRHGEGAMRTCLTFVVRSVK